MFYGHDSTFGLTLVGVGLASISLSIIMGLNLAGW